MSLEFIRYADGSCALLDGGELQWSSDNDEDFLGEFDAHIDSEEIDDVLAWLEDAGYIERDESVDVADEGDGTIVVEDNDAENEEDYDDEAEGA